MKSIDIFKLIFRCQCTLAWIEDHKAELKNPSDRNLPILVTINSQDLSMN